MRQGTAAARDEGAMIVVDTEIAKETCGSQGLIAAGLRIQI